MVYVFGEFLREEREERGISSEMLCEGLCSSSMMIKIEEGERAADKLMRGRLFGRLGLAERAMEDFVPLEEYEEWRKRECIVNAVEKGDTALAGKLLRQYKKVWTEENRLEHQQMLCLGVQCMIRAGSPAEEIVTAQEEALRLTVPRWRKVPLQELLLSLEELDMILECLHWQQSSKVADYLELLHYIQHSGLGEDIRARIYPKACWYTCRKLLASMEEQEKPQVFCQALELCNQAIQLLRSQRKMFYLWELLELRKKLIEQLTGVTGEMLTQQFFGVPEQIAETFGEQSEGQDKAAFVQWYQESCDWQEALRQICYEVLELDGQENDAREAAEELLRTKDSCYVYRDKEVYCFSEVIRRRRIMLGLSQEQLCDGICSLKTMRRLEKGQTRTQPYIVHRMLKRVGLTGEYQSMRLIGVNRKSWKLTEELEHYSDERKREQAEELLAQLKEKISAEHPINRQYILRQETILANQKQTLAPEEYIRRMIEALECTMPLQGVDREGKKYLTSHEILCVYSIMLKLEESTGNQKYSQMFQEIYSDYEEEGTLFSWIRQYELVMSHIASELGNMGEYEASNALGKKIMRYDLMCRRLNMFYINYHSNMWNEKQEMDWSNPEQVQRYKKKLETCIILAQLGESPFYERHYKKELSQID